MDAKKCQGKKQLKNTIYMLIKQVGSLMILPTFVQIVIVNLHLQGADTIVENVASLYV